MQFTPDGYTEALAPRITHLGLGAAILAGGIAGGWFVSWCLAVPLVLIGLGVMVNEGGQKRIRVTRRHLLLENEYRVWGLLVGPVRNRIRWEETQDAAVAGDVVKLTKTDGSAVELGKGGSASDLQTFADRINQRLENFRNPVD